MHAGAVGGPGEAAAGDMDLAVDHGGSGVVARLRQRRRVGPFVGRGVVDLVRRNGGAVGCAAADGVDLAVERDHRDRTATRLHRRQHAPGVERGIVFEGGVLPILVHAAADEAANRIDLAVEHGAADVIERARQWRARTPLIGGGVVFDVVGAGEAQHAAPNHVHLAAAIADVDLVECGRERRLRRPAPRRLGIGGLAMGATDQRQKRDGSGGEPHTVSCVDEHHVLPALGGEITTEPP